MRKFNFGKERAILTRGQSYISLFLMLFQHATNAMLWVKTYGISLTAIVLIIAGLLFIAILFILFMRFDINRNIPAEYEWTWKINPAYKELVDKLDSIERRLKNDS